MRRATRRRCAIALLARGGSKGDNARKHGAPSPGKTHISAGIARTVYSMTRMTPRIISAWPGKVHT